MVKAIKIAARPSASPTTVMASAAAADAITSVALMARKRSAARVMSDTAATRTVSGTAMTSPMVAASNPRASSQTGKNGSWIPPNRK